MLIIRFVCLDCHLTKFRWVFILRRLKKTIHFSPHFLRCFENCIILFPFALSFAKYLPVFSKKKKIQVFRWEGTSMRHPTFSGHYIIRLCIFILKYDYFLEFIPFESEYEIAEYISLFCWVYSIQNLKYDRKCNNVVG